MSELQMPLAGFGPDPAAPLPKGRKTFDRLVKKIQEARESLEAWATVLAPYQKTFTNELLPLRATCRTLRIGFVRRLDEALDAQGLTQAERRGAQRLVVELTAALLEEGDDPDLRALYKRRARGDYEEHAAKAREAAAAAFEETYGIDPEAPIEEILRRAAWQRGGDADGEHVSPAWNAPSETEHRGIRESIRALYRKLASALHPDREPDPDKRDHKTALMQRANHAYENDRLLPLLELRRELDPGQGPWAGEDEQAVKLYTKALRHELKALEEEVMVTEADFRVRFAVDPDVSLSPRNALKTLATEIKETRAMADSLERELTDIADRASLKRWLRALRDERLF